MFLGRVTLINITKYFYWEIIQKPDDQKIFEGPDEEESKCLSFSTGSN